MNILFMFDKRTNAGSIQAVASYVRAGDERGHTIAAYGKPNPMYHGLRWSTDLGGFDHILFIYEFGIGWMSGLRMARILTGVPRSKRAILDADGMYNEVISVDMYDRNHADEQQRARWVGHCDGLSDRIFQPALEPILRNVRPLQFYGYDPALRITPDARPKRFDIVYVGHNWWRGREVSRCLLPAIESIRPKLDGICFVGLWWDMPPAGASEQNLEIAFDFDPDQLRRLGIQLRPAVPFTQVVSTMSEGLVNIMTQRPLFRRLKLLTAKYFEIFCADTVPLLMLDPDDAEAVYGPAGRELALHGDVAGRLLDAVQNPARYRNLVEEVRRHLDVHHSYSARVQQLVEALQG